MDKIEHIINVALPKYAFLSLGVIGTVGAFFNWAHIFTALIGYAVYAAIRNEEKEEQL